MPLTDLDVELIGEDGNAFYILGKVRGSLKRNGHADLAEKYMEEATAGDYNHLLSVTAEYVNIV